MSSHPLGTILHLYTQPKASKNEVIGRIQDGIRERLKVRIQAPPVDGEANEELVHFLKKLLKPMSHKGVELLRGESSRHKDVLIHGVSPTLLEAWIEQNIK